MPAICSIHIGWPCKTHSQLEHSSNTKAPTQRHPRRALQAPQNSAEAPQSISFNPTCNVPAVAIQLQTEHMPRMSVHVGAYCRGHSLYCHCSCLGCRLAIASEPVHVRGKTPDSHRLVKAHKAAWDMFAHNVILALWQESSQRVLDVILCSPLHCVCRAGGGHLSIPGSLLCLLIHIDSSTCKAALDNC